MSPSLKVWPLLDTQNRSHFEREYWLQIVES